MQNRVEENSYRPWRGLALVSGVALAVMFVFSQLIHVGQASAIQPELAVGKMVAQPQAPAGSTLDYTIVITNSGTEFAPDVVMRDELSVYTAFVAGSFSSDRGGSLEVNAQVITWTGGLNANDQATLTFQAYLTDTAVSGTTITNTAIVSDVNGLLVDTAVTEIVTLPDLSGAKVVSQAEASGGDTLTYTITVSNSGGVTANNIRITDTLPAQLTYVSGSATASSGDVTTDANTIYWQGDIDTMAQVEVSFAAVLGSPLPVGSVITNTAHLDYEGMIWALTAATTITDSGLFISYLPLIFQVTPTPDLAASPVNQSNNSWTLSWSEAVTGITGFELHESQTADFSQYDVYTFGSNTTSYFVQRLATLDGRFYYRIRALTNGQNSPWSQPLLVQGVAFDPQLSATRPNSANAWTVSWSVNGTPEAFELQQAQNPEFSGAATFNLPGSALSRDFNPAPSYHNDYYYRIRAVSGGQVGAWSEILPVVGGFYDDFSDPNNKWDVRRTTYLEKIGSEHQNGRLLLRVDDRWDWGIFSPLKQAPALPYAIEYRADIYHQANLTTKGAVFGGDWNGGPCFDPSTFDSIYKHDDCFNQFYNTNTIWYGGLKVLFEKVDYLFWCFPFCEGGGSPMKRLGHNYDEWFVEDITTRTDPNGYNTYRIEVRTNSIRLYVNDQHYATSTATQWVNEPYFGLFASADEYKPSEWYFDYYSVMPLD